MRNARFRFVIFAGAAIALFSAAGPAHADPYKWCAVYSGGDDGGGGGNCGFVTLEQCRATLSGIGGSCEPNPFYTGPDSTPKPIKRKRVKNERD
jgi:hypothetical protein